MPPLSNSRRHGVRGGCGKASRRKVLNERKCLGFASCVWPHRYTTFPHCGARRTEPCLRRSAERRDRHPECRDGHDQFATLPRHLSRCLVHRRAGPARPRLRPRICHQPQLLRVYRKSCWRRRNSPVQRFGRRPHPGQSGERSTHPHHPGAGRQPTPPRWLARLRP